MILSVWSGPRSTMDIDFLRKIDKNVNVIVASHEGRM